MKKCEVLSYNPHRHVLVFKYDNEEIQVHCQLDSVPEFIYATYANGVYEISLKKNVKSKNKIVKNEEVLDSESLKDD